jgi:hypothetical protein
MSGRGLYLESLFAARVFAGWQSSDGLPAPRTVLVKPKII